MPALAASLKRPALSHEDESTAASKRPQNSHIRSHRKPATDENYQLIEVIGRGGFGTITKVQKKGDPTAIYARKQLDLSEIRQEDIRNEIQVMRKVHHHHVVEVIDAFCDSLEAWYYIILTPVADCNLAKYLQSTIRHPRTALDREIFGQQRLLLLRWMLCLAKALCHIHSLDVRHRDIKPQNILVHGRNILFTDFGTSYCSVMDTRYTFTKTPGTTKYMPPEASGERRFGRKGDVFSLGCVYWEMAEAIFGSLLTTPLPRIGTLSYAAAAAQGKFGAEFIHIAENRILVSRLPEKAQLSPNFAESIVSLTCKMLCLIPDDRCMAESVVDELMDILEASGSSPAPCCSLSSNVEEPTSSPGAETPHSSESESDSGTTNTSAVPAASPSSNTPSTVTERTANENTNHPQEETTASAHRATFTERPSHLLQGDEARESQSSSTRAENLAARTLDPRVTLTCRITMMGGMDERMNDLTTLEDNFFTKSLLEVRRELGMDEQAISLTFRLSMPLAPRSSDLWERISFDDDAGFEWAKGQLFDKISRHCERKQTRVAHLEILVN